MTHFDIITKLEVTSPAFANEGNIPSRYSLFGDNVNPPLEIKAIPTGTVSLVLLIENRQTSEKSLVHWIVWDIFPVKKIMENRVPGIEGINDFIMRKYQGPCQQSGTHNYVFRIFACNRHFNFKIGETVKNILKKVEEHLTGYGEISATFTR